MSVENIPDQDDRLDIEEFINDDYKLVYSGLKAAAKYNFSVGDVIIKNTVSEDLNGNQKLSPVEISRTNPSPKKFKVVAVDKFGIPWIRQINSSTGGLGGSLESLASFGSYIHFTPDREQAESILMGSDDYDPLEAAKKKRKEIIALRKRNKAKLFTSSSSLEWGQKLKTLKRSQELWFSPYKDGMGEGGTFFATKKDLEYSRIRVLGVTTVTTKKQLLDLIDKGVISYYNKELAEKMIKDKEEIVVVKYVTKDWNGNWCSGRDAYYIHNVGVSDKSYGANNYETYSMYTEEPECEKTE